MSIGERIKNRRQEIGLTQVELAAAINTTKQNLYKYENGIITNIPADKIEAIAEKLFTTPEYLMGWTDKPTKQKSRITLGDIMSPPEVELKDLPLNLKKRCLELNLSFKDLAAKTGIKEFILQEYANGRFRYVTFTKLDLLANALGISTNELVGWHEIGHGVDNSYGALYDLLSYLGYEYETTQTPQNEIDGYLSQGYELADDGVSEIDRIRSRKTNACYQVKPEQLTEMMTDLNKYMEFLIQKLISQCPEIHADDGRTYYRVRDYPED